MEYQVEQAIEVLGATPGVLDAMLSGLSDPWVMNNYGPDTFSPFDVVGHLIHGEKADWIPRAQIILDYGEARPFEPFNRYAMYEASKGKTIGDLLAMFAELRGQNIAHLRAMNLTEEQLSLTGIHPELGRVTLENHLALWVCHDLSHTHQIAKSMAFLASGTAKARASIARVTRSNTAMLTAVRRMAVYSSSPAMTMVVCRHRCHTNPTSHS